MNIINTFKWDTCTMVNTNIDKYYLKCERQKYMTFGWHIKRQVIKKKRFKIYMVLNEGRKDSLLHMWIMESLYCLQSNFKDHGCGFVQALTHRSWAGIKS